MCSPISSRYWSNVVIVATPFACTCRLQTISAIDGKDKDSTFTQNRVNEFLFRHLPSCRCSAPGTRSVKTCRAAFGHLDVVLGESRVDGTDTPVDREISCFGEYLRVTCGLSDSTRSQRCRYVHELLSERFGNGPVAVHDLTARDPMRYASQRARTLSTGSMGVVASSMRSYLRFLHFRGRIGDALLYAVPALRSVTKEIFPGLCPIRRSLSSCERLTGTRPAAPATMRSRCVWLSLACAPPKCAVEVSGRCPWSSLHRHDHDLRKSQPDGSQNGRLAVARGKRMSSAVLDTSSRQKALN